MNPLIPRLLRYALVATTLWYVGAYLVVACLRMTYPFDLEWMEGGSVDHVMRILHHQGLYVVPQIAFIPFEYPPLYFYVSAFVSRIIGIGYFPLRLVSFVASLVSFASIYRIVKAETRSAVAGMLAAGLFAATFRWGGAWFDLARVDSLFLALFLLAVQILRSSTSSRSHLVAGLLLSLSFLTKQTALAMALPVVLYEMYARPRLGLWLTASLVSIVGLSTLLLHAATDGWYTFYVFEFPFKHAWAPPVYVTFWTRDLFTPLPIAFAGALLLVLWQLRFQRERLFWPVVFAGMLGGAYRSRLQTGGWDNVLLPAYAITATLFGIGVGKLVDAIRRRDMAYRRLAEAAVYAGCLAQMALLAFDPRPQVPRAADARAGQQLLNVMAGVKGEVLLPYHGYLPTLVGKPSHAHVMQAFDVLKIQDAHSEQLAGQYRAAIGQAAFGAIILDDNVNYPFMPEIERTYVLQSRLFAEPGVFFPVTGGIITRPEYVYVPKPGVGRSVAP